MARLGKRDWIHEGLTVLSEIGYEGIKIDRLCKRLDISIGSFYHHFKNIDDYVDQMIAEWENRMHAHFVDSLEQEVPAQERLRLLHEQILEHPPKLEVAVRAWAFQNGMIDKAVEKMDKKRVRLMGTLFMEMGHSPEDARQLAEIQYAAYLGVQTYCVNRSRATARKLFLSIAEMMHRTPDTPVSVTPS